MITSLVIGLVNKNYTGNIFLCFNVILLETLKLDKELETTKYRYQIIY